VASIFTWGSLVLGVVLGVLTYRIRGSRQVRLYLFFGLVCFWVVVAMLLLSPLKHLRTSAGSTRELQRGTNELTLQLSRGAYVLKVGENLHGKRRPAVAFSVNGTITNSSRKVSIDAQYDPQSDYDGVFIHFDVVQSTEDLRIKLVLAIPEEATNSISVWCFPAK
jgi:hypothetical protein